ncbi:MAG: hypothetical protein HY290_10925, partial [Planctomycetia bacterium]|nr:hypothetical protein [Planctomycetia bacterium]
FRPGHNRIDWLDGSIDPFDPIRKLSDCGQWLKDLLAEKDQHSTMVIGLGKEYGFSEGQVRRAFKEIGARPHRVGCQKGSRVMWSLDEKCGVRNSECGMEDAGDSPDRADAAPVMKSTPLPAEVAAVDANEAPREVYPARPADAPAAELNRVNGDGQVAKAASPGRILGVEELPWAGSPSSRLAPLSAMLDRPHNPNQLLRNLPDLKSVKSMQSSKIAK